MNTERNFRTSVIDRHSTSECIVSLHKSSAQSTLTRSTQASPCGGDIDYSEKYKDILLRKSKSRRLEASKRTIEKTFEKNLQVTRLADDACMSKSYFCREFKRSFGISPHKFIIECRLSAAKYLLINSDLSVTYITHAVGFRNRSSFSRLFKTHHGISPHQFRDSQKQD